jgi:hypothetical protein
MTFSHLVHWFGSRPVLMRQWDQEVSMAATEVAMTFLVWVPVVFWDDHVSRDLDHTSTIIKTVGNRYQVLMTIEAMRELESDADYYGFFMKEYERDGGRSVCSSARATLKALEKQGY